MKIGLACSGCGPGAQYAYILAEELTYLSLGPEMISCNSLPAAPMLLWSRGLPTDEIKKRTDRLFQEKNLIRHYPVFVPDCLVYSVAPLH